ncbi:MAG: cytochrome c peroxidase [Rhizobacter sp.]
MTGGKLRCFVALVLLCAGWPASAADVELGRRLFFDTRLSSDGRVACADCHQPTHAFTVPSAVAQRPDGPPGLRRPPSLLSAASRTHWGWDGRGTELARQCLVPLEDPSEMGPLDVDQLVNRLKAEPVYARALASAPALDVIGAALAAYVASLDTPSRFDHFIAGDAQALDERELRGLHIFRTKAGCANCHTGPALTDEQFHNLGLSSFGERSQDLGRHGVTGRLEDAGAFRTPSLRHVAQRAPYMHHGLIPTLEGVVHFYNHGGGEVWVRNEREAAEPLHRAAAQRSPHLRSLGLSDEEKAALLAFLRAL